METYATTKGQIVIPSALRRKYGIKVGTKILIYEGDDSIILKPVTEQYLKKLQGSLKGKGMMKTLTESRSQNNEAEK
jgi:AbrB family looped-hinge helix DNA binding protein